jgi:hypothetical protein
MKKQSLSQIVDEIISELPLNDRVLITHMNKKDAVVLQSVFELYITRKTGTKFDDEEYKDVMDKLWKRLRGTHKLRVVK